MRIVRGGSSALDALLSVPLLPSNSQTIDACVGGSVGRFPLPPTLKITILLQKPMLFQRKLTDVYCISVKSMLFHHFHPFCLRTTSPSQLPFATALHKTLPNSLQRLPSTTSFNTSPSTPLNNHLNMHPPLHPSSLAFPFLSWSLSHLNRNSQIAIGWTEECCEYLDSLMSIDFPKTTARKERALGVSCQGQKAGQRRTGQISHKQ